MLYITTLYCGPRTRTGRERGRDGAGLYPELASLGFSKGASPALVSTVARLSVLMPSFEQAHREMAHRGVELNLKTVRRITERLGVECLTTRTRDLLAWQAGQMPAGRDLAGKRVGVAIDAGRTRLRECRRPQRRKGQRITRRRRYAANWREPKLLIIFELDEKGRMKRGTKAWIDGTFEGPDHLMQLLAFHLHRLGAAEARNVAFLGDGAPWIWDRLDWVQQQVGLAPQKTQRILDWCHAVHHISLALQTLNLSKTVRQQTFRRLRQHLRAGRVHRVLTELEDRAKGKAKHHAVRVAVAYLKKHEPHMHYNRLRASGLPIGSGAIESAIRRVVNQRLKSPGTIWLKDHAEAMLVLRAAALTDRWDETSAHVRATMATNRRLDWHWSAPAITAEPQASRSHLKPHEKRKRSSQQSVASTRDTATEW